MIEQMTWQAFWLAYLAGCLIWYAVVLLAFYPAALRGIFGGKGPCLQKLESGSPDKRPAQNQDGVKNDIGPEDGLMGRSRLPEGVEVLSAGQVAFTASTDGRYDQVGLVADLVQELKEIFVELEKSAGSKADFFRMVKVIGEEYGRIAGHPSIGSINAFIRESAPFFISEEELENLWY